MPYGRASLAQPDAGELDAAADEARAAAMLAEVVDRREWLSRSGSEAVAGSRLEQLSRGKLQLPPRDRKDWYD